MTPRAAILGKIRGALSSGNDDARRAAVEARLAKVPKGVIPARGQLDDVSRIDLFCAMAEKVTCSVARVRSHDHVPKAVSDYLRARNLPHAIRVGEDKRLKTLPWDTIKTLEIRRGASDGQDEAGLSHALAGAPSFSRPARTIPPPSISSPSTTSSSSTPGTSPATSRP